MISSIVNFNLLPEADRFPAWEAEVHPFYDLQPIDSHLATQAKWRVWTFGDLLFSESKYTPARFERTAGRFSDEANEFLLLEIYRSGTSRVSVGDTRFNHKPWHVYLMDMSRPFVNEAGAAETRGVLIPHAAIGYDPSRHPSVITLSPDSPAGRIVSHAIWTLTDRLTHASEPEASEIAENILGVLRGLMLDGENRADAEIVRTARRLAMENYIEARLGQREISVGELCATFGVSRASLYRHFPETGGVASYIRHRRLLSARNQLEMAEARRGLISDISERWGFSDPGHFHRLFKREFNLRPGEVAATPHVAVQEQVTIAGFVDRWMAESVR